MSSKSRALVVTLLAAPWMTLSPAWSAPSQSSSAPPAAKVKQGAQSTFVTNAYFSDKLLKVSGFIQPNAVINLLRAKHKGIVGYFVMDMVMDRGEHQFDVEILDKQGRKVGDLGFEPVVASENDFVYTMVGAVTGELPEGWLLFKVYDQVRGTERLNIGAFRVMSRVMALEEEGSGSLLDQAAGGDTASGGVNPLDQVVEEPVPFPVPKQPEAAKKAEPVVQAPMLLKEAPPATKPEPPVAKPEPPVAKPEPPVAKPEPPVAKPEPPAAKLEPPVAKPESPVAKPEPPVAKPESPVAKPETPVAKPETPVAKPEPPVAKPEPEAKQETEEEKPEPEEEKQEAEEEKPEPEKMPEPEKTQKSPPPAPENQRDPVQEPGVGKKPEAAQKTAPSGESRAPVQEGEASATGEGTGPYASMLLGRTPPPVPSSAPPEEGDAGKQSEAKKETTSSKEEEYPRSSQPPPISAVTRGFVVQLGIYSVPEYAEDMKRQVSGLGMPVGEKLISTAGKSVTRVFLGPFGTREEAEGAAHRVRAQVRLKDAAIVIPYP